MLTQHLCAYIFVLLSMQQKCALCQPLRNTNSWQRMLDKHAVWTPKKKQDRMEHRRPDPLERYDLKFEITGGSCMIVRRDPSPTHRETNTAGSTDSSLNKPKRLKRDILLGHPLAESLNSVN